MPNNRRLRWRLRRLKKKHARLEAKINDLRYAAKRPTNDDPEWVKLQQELAPLNAEIRAIEDRLNPRPPQRRWQ